MSTSQTILVTGTSSGFGKLITRTLAGRGHTVVATMRDPEGRNAATAAELNNLGENVHILELDVTSDDSVTNAVNAAETITGGIDGIVNNAGIGAGGHAEAFTAEQLTAILDINVVGVQRVTRAALPAMRSRGRGIVVTISSIMGRIVIPWSAPYTATKWAVEGLMESYRHELTGTGVDVVVIEPGGFDTGIGTRMLAPADTDRAATYGDLADAPTQLWSGFMEALSAGGPDPQIVADAVADAVDAPAGGRPFRTVVDPFMGGGGATTVNQTSDAVQTALMKSLSGDADAAQG